jgi:acyl dehydratase
MQIGELSVGAALPALRVVVTAKMIIMGAIASRDWQPQHHDVAWATGGAGLPGIIMNNYTQAGWISRYITDWCGEQGRIGRLLFAMKRPLCPGDEVAFSGSIKAMEPGNDAMFWTEIAVALETAKGTATTATVRLALPASVDAPSVWRCTGARWRP